MATSGRKRVGVVGAGVSGLAALKQCLDAGLEPTAFERHSRLGGIWAFDETLRDGQGSALYEAVVTNTSKEISCFSDFPYHLKDPPYLPHRKVLSYYQRFAQHHKLVDRIRFGTSVVRIERAPRDGERAPGDGKTASSTVDDSGWKIKTKTTDENGETKEEEHIFDFVLLCSGVYSKPFVPDIPGLSSFAGRVIHSNEFRRAADFSGADVVVVIGASHSAGDVAVEASRVVDQVWLSARNGTWIIPRAGPGGVPVDFFALTRFNQLWVPESVRSFIGGRTLDGRIGHERFGLKSTRPLLQGSTMVNDEIVARILAGEIKAKPDVKRFTQNGIEFVDGTKVENVDVVVFATGYTPTWSYIDSSLVPSGEEKMNLYEYVFPPKLGRHPTLAVIGSATGPGAHGPVIEMQCRWATRIFNREIHLPSPDVMRQHVRREKAETLARFGRPRAAVLMIPYLDRIASYVGCRPNLVKLALTDPRLAFNILFGPCVSPIYRLTGPNPWPGARDAILSAKYNTAAPTMTRSVGSTNYKNKGVKTFEFTFLFACLLACFSVALYNLLHV